MRSSSRRAVVFGAWAVAAAIVVACSADEVTSPRPDAGAPSDGGSQTEAASSGPDSGPDADLDASGAADGGALWAFNAYCQEEDGGCQAFVDCPSVDGGPAQTSCSAPLARCVVGAPPASGLFGRVFACEPTGKPIWELNRLCSFEPCDALDAAACPTPPSAGFAGQICATIHERCISGGKVFACQPTGQIEVFNGYCDAGPGTAACNPAFDACAPGPGGNPCAVDLERCLVALPDGGGAKIFVCTDR